MKEILTFLMIFAEDKGRSKYGTGEVGICPRTARNYAKALYNFLTNVPMDVDRLWPMWNNGIRAWVRELSEDKLYRRKHAGYLPKSDLRLFLKAIRETIIENPDSSVGYYAAMAEAIIAIIYTQTGSRTGELLRAQTKTVFFGEADGKITVAIYPNGAKAR